MNKIGIKSLQLISVRWWNATAYYAVILSKVLNREGVSAVVAGYRGTPAIKKAKNFNLPVLDKINLESKNPYELLKSYSNLKQFVKQKRPQILNAHRPEDHLFAGLLRKASDDIRLVRTVGDVRYPKDNPVNKWLHLQATDFFIFTSLANKKRYQKVWPIPEEKCAVIYASVNTDYFNPDQSFPDLREKYILNKHIVFGHIGRFSPVKDHVTFLKAGALAAQKNEEISFIVSGKEVEISKNELKNMTKKLKIQDRVNFLDKTDDVRRLISAVDVGVVSSKDSEAICRIATEYLAMGKPVIVTDINVLPEMIENGKNGFVVPAQSPKTMAEKMLCLAENRDLLKKLSQNARQTALTRFSDSKLFEATMKIYKQLIPAPAEK